MFSDILSRLDAIDNLNFKGTTDMSQISQFSNPWRDMLMQQASFRGVIFHVETGARLKLDLRDCC